MATLFRLEKGFSDKIYCIAKWAHSPRGLPARNGIMLKLLNFSIVVVAEHHNPTILSPDFLARNEIVPDDWGWKLREDCFSTPPLAQVKYENGLSVLCEQSKLQVVDGGDNVNPAKSPVDAIAVSYLRTLPHVRYTGLGVNFKAIIPCEQPSSVLMGRFLKAGPWTAPEQGLEDMGLRLVYAIDHGRLRLSLDAGEVNSEEGKDVQTVVLAGANFHHDLPDDAPVDQVEQIVKRKTEYWEHFQSMVSQIVDHEGSKTR